VPPVYSAQSDIFAFGGLLWELAARGEPFQKNELVQIKLWIESGVRPVIPSGVPEEVRWAIEGSWAQEATSRTRRRRAWGCWKGSRRVVEAVELWLLWETLWQVGRLSWGRSPGREHAEWCGKWNAPLIEAYPSLSRFCPHSFMFACMQLPAAPVDSTPFAIANSLYPSPRPLSLKSSSERARAASRAQTG
jgi:hypothetical protein